LVALVLIYPKLGLLQNFLQLRKLLEAPHKPHAALVSYVVQACLNLIFNSVSRLIAIVTNTNEHIYAK